MSYSITKKSIIVFLAAYFIIGIASRFLSRSAENFYPFFSWFLFIEVPPRIQNDFEILVHRVGDKEFSPAINATEAKILNISSPPNDYYNLVRNIGRNANNLQNQDIDSLRKKLESNFLNHPIIYEIAEITYDNIERFKSGAILKSRTVKIFNSRQ